MKRFALVAAGVAALFVPAVALGFFARDWNGNIKGEETISLIAYDVHKTATGKRKVANFLASGITFTCPNGSTGRTEAWETDDRYPIDHGEFKGRSNVTNAGTDPVMKVAGEFLGGGKAKGTVRLRGNIRPGHPKADCDTGRQKWVADKSSGVN